MEAALFLDVVLFCKINFWRIILQIDFHKRINGYAVALSSSICRKHAPPIERKKEKRISSKKYGYCELARIGSRMSA